MTLDPVIAWSVRTGLALLFAAAAWHKLGDSRRFEAAVRAYELIPSSWAGPLTRMLPAIEAAIAAGLILPSLGAPAAAAAGMLLSVYTSAIAVSLARGRRDIDCGCFGARLRVPLSGALIGRNLVLIAGAALLALPAGTRPLVWIDWLTMIGTVLVLSLLWVTTQRLARTGPALRNPGGLR